ncbi:glycerophosphodiester phosphodiesterase [Marinobacter zhejiangensis]|uniref:Glycerophosphoryl diester phosphodiesterase n=1 Tax=Marinobacter zhejiangensis TaxID=488535 RepID=A0A1I4NSM3_9GAMM|nr:glycerophosphodiester phosphodiesterase [Marinobacter zhejiangensis]SFM18522.1 glycerophosphoryl diester phosphodiesterase [Marinobacter zhejiangensis]
MIIYGHRGAKGEAPENTLSGFELAYRHGIRRFEFDLVLAKDGLPVVIHDLTLERTTGQSGKVADYTAADLAKMDARRNVVSWPTPAPIPSLEAVLAVIPEFEHLQLEVKSDKRNRLNILCNRLTELIQQRDLYERVVVTSSDTWFLQEIRRRNRRIAIGVVVDSRFPKPTSVAARLGCEYLILNWKLCSKALVDDAHRRDIKVSTWTVNSIHDMLTLEEHGVDSIITDYPTSAKIFFDNRRSALPHLTPEREDDDQEPSLSTSA